MFRVMKLGRYVLVDDGGINYVTFHKLYVRIKIFNYAKRGTAYGGVMYGAGEKR